MNKRVLDVGQCDPDHGSIRRVIEPLGAEVVRAHTAREAISLARAERFDLILVNRVLDADGSSGLELISTLQGDEQLRQVPVMLVSNYEDAQREAVAVGARPGFGKAALRDPKTTELLVTYLGNGASPQQSA